MEIPMTRLCRILGVTKTPKREAENLFVRFDSAGTALYMIGVLISHWPDSIIPNPV